LGNFFSKFIIEGTFKSGKFSSWLTSDQWFGLAQTASLLPLKVQKSQGLEALEQLAWAEKLQVTWYRNGHALSPTG